MTRDLRFRDRSETLTGTRIVIRDGIPTGSSLTGTVSLISTCVDFHGRPVVEGTLNSIQRKSNLLINGKAMAPTFGGGSEGYLYTGYPHSPSFPNVDTGNLNVPGTWYGDLVARTNPSRPELTPANLIQDLVEIPRQLQDVGRLMRSPKKILSAKEIANQNLAVSFGWLPFIRDVNQLLDLQHAISKRSSELGKLYAGKGLRRRIPFDDDSQSSQYTERTTISSGRFFDVSYDVSVRRRNWGTIHWFPTTPPPWRQDDDRMRAYARDIVLGLTPEGLVKGAWDVIPWTWLAGYFTNFGNYLLANSRTVPASHSSGCMMSEVIARVSPKSVIPNGLDEFSVNVTGSYTYSRKVRLTAGFVGVGFRLPFLGPFRLSILGSLAVQRLSR